MPPLVDKPQTSPAPLIVVKLGGAIVDNREARANIISQLAQLHSDGARVILVHGGGKRINAALREAGLEPSFYEGLRVTDDATMAIVERVLAEEINSELARAIQEQGCRAMFGKDTKILRSAPYDENSPLGRVGKVVRVNKLSGLAAKIAVAAPVGYDLKNNLAYNINADWAAAEIAIAYEADCLVYATDQDGIVDAEGRVISEIPAGQLEGLIAAEVITDGMIPKARSFATALARGVKQILLLNGLKPNSIIGSLTRQEEVGTKIIP